MHPATEVQVTGNIGGLEQGTIFVGSCPKVEVKKWGASGWSNRYRFTSDVNATEHI